MDVLFINATPTLELRSEVNGTMLLATKLLQAGFQADILRFGQIENYGKDYQAFIREITDKIIASGTKCVSFYTLWPSYHVMLRIASELKERNRNIVTVFGGPQASATAEATMASMPFIDYICTGEGERTVVPFFTAVLRTDGSGLASVPGLYYRMNGSIVHNNLTVPLTDLESLPRWDDRLLSAYDPAQEPHIRHNAYFMPIDVGRGCPYSCTFCCTSYFWKRTYRLKLPQQIVSDIQYYQEKYGITSFWFSHDAFTSDKKLISAVCDQILEKQLNIQWRCSARVDCLTEELILKMKQAGLTQIEMGIETGSARMQKLINKRLDLEKARSIIAFLRKNKIHVSLFFIYGFPEETEADLNETLEYLFSMVDAGVQKVDLFFCRFNPLTDITVRNMDQLVFAPDVKPLHRTMDVYNEELQMIIAHKELFPFLYHLNTPVRNEYQDLFALIYIYQKFPKTVRYLRGLYAGDNLRFYQDFVRQNAECFAGSYSYIISCIKNKSWEMLCNVLDVFDKPCTAQLKELMRFERDVQAVNLSAEDCAVHNVYGFHYLDYKLNRPIESYCNGTTEILLQKTDGKISMKVMRISGTEA